MSTRKTKTTTGIFDECAMVPEKSLTEVFAVELPKDKMMLLSVINTRLRDQYASLDALCEDMNVERAAIEADLAEIGYAYDKTLNRFV